jgi:hypothetical protein
MRFRSGPEKPLALPAPLSAEATLSWFVVCAIAVKSMPPLAPLPVMFR